MNGNSPIQTNRGDNQQRQDNPSLVDNSIAAQGSSASIPDISNNWQLENFHKFANCMDLYDFLPDQNKDTYKQSLETNYAKWMQKICGNTLKKNADSVLFQMFRGSVGEGANDLQRKMVRMFSDYGYADINKKVMTDEFMISIMNYWYPFSVKEKCWFSTSNLESIHKLWLSNELSGRVCRACATHFINVSRNQGFEDHRLRSKL